MNKPYKVVASILAVSTLIGGTYEADATENSGEIKESAITYGGDLSESQKDETRKDLNAESGKFKEYDINVQDVQRYTGVNYDYIYSSSVIEPKRFGKGVSVEIETPDNITKITKEQYINSAISAGIQNANIRIASIEPTTGDGALTGIYKAYEEQGNELNEEDMQNANDEMTQLSDISEQNKGQDGYSDEAMNNAVADMKKQVAEKQADNGSVSEQEVRQIVDEELSKKGLDKVLNDNQRNSIYNIIINVSQSKTLKTNPEAIKDQLSKYQKYLEKEHGDLIDKAKSLNTEENRNFLSNLWHKITEIFHMIIDWISSLFK